MLDLGLVLGVIGVIGIPVAVGTGLAVAVKTPQEFWFVRGCFVVAALLTVVSFIWLTHELPLGPVKTTAAAIIGAITLVALVGGFDWLSKKEEAVKKEEATSLSIKPKENDLALLVECFSGVMPTTPERIYALNLFPVPAENGGGGLAEYFSFDNKGERTWPKSKTGFPLMAYKCQLTNYGTAPLFNVFLALHLQFQNSIAEDNGSERSGEVYLRRDWPISISKIDPGTSNPFVFTSTRCWINILFR